MSRRSRITMWLPAFLFWMICASKFYVTNETTYDDISCLWQLLNKKNDVHLDFTGVRRFIVSFWNIVFYFRPLLFFQNVFHLPFGDKSIIRFKAANSVQCISLNEFLEGEDIEVTNVEKNRKIHWYRYQKIVVINSVI